MISMLEESARNHIIILQWRIKSLKSSEWMIIPESSVQYWNLLFAPPTAAAKHAFHRLSDQGIDCGNGFWRFSFNLQKWTATFFETSYAEREKFPWFNIDPIPSFNGNDSWWRASKFSSLWFCFCLWSACKISRIQLYRKFSELFFRNYCVVVQIHHKIIWSMRKFWPKSEYCLCLKTKLWSQLHIYRANNY